MNQQTSDSRKPESVEEVIAKVKAKYTARYARDGRFRRAVHERVKLGFLERAHLKTLRGYDRQNYRRILGRNVIERYVLQRLEEMDRSSLMSALQNMRSLADKRDILQQQAASQSTSMQQSMRETELEKTIAEQQFDNEADKLRREKDEKLKEAETRPEEIKRQLTEQLTAALQQGGLLGGLGEGKGQNDSVLVFNEDYIVERLSELFLNDVLDKLEDRGYGYRALLEGKSAIEFTDRGLLRDEAEVSRMDAVASKLRARSYGRRRMELDDIVVKKTESEGTIKAVVALDKSGSMSGNKIEIAKKTALCVGKALEKMNPANYIAYMMFGNDAYVVDRAALFKADANEGTNMTAAINRAFEMLEEENADTGVFYLVSDGYPNDQQSAIEAAKKFEGHPNYYMRLFLIDPDPNSIATTKNIGEAAGPNSRFVPVRAESLDTEILDDLFRIYSGIYTADEFGDGCMREG